MVDILDVETTFDKLLDGATERVKESFERYPATPLSLDDAVKWELIAIGESIDGDALLAKLRETEPDLEIEDFGLNREAGYIWARVKGGEDARDEETFVIPRSYFRYLSILSKQPMSTVLQDVDAA